MRWFVSAAAFALLTTSVFAEDLTDAQWSGRLPGKWRQVVDVPGPLGVMKTQIDTSYLNNGRFQAVTVMGPYKIIADGTWKVKNGILTHDFVDWSPRKLRNVDGSESPILMPSESLRLESIDENAFRNKAGVVRRVR